MSSTLEAIRHQGKLKLEVPPSTAALVEEALEVAVKLFALPEDEKRKCFLDKDLGRWGWRPKAWEGKGPEQWQIDQMAPEIAWPSSMAEERALLTQLADEATSLLKGLFRETFERYGAVGDADLDHPDTTVIFRILHYGPGGRDIAFAAHEDFGWATVFMAETCRSLQTKSEDGQWVWGDAAPNDWLIITGKLMREFTQGAMQPLVHRVVKPEMERYSLVAVLDVGESTPDNARYARVMEEFRKERVDRTKAAVDFLGKKDGASV